MHRAYTFEGPSALKERLRLYDNEYLSLIYESKIRTALLSVSKTESPSNAIRATDVWETLGDAVYNMLWYRYIYQQSIRVNAHTYSTGLSNRVMKCLMVKYPGDLIQINPHTIRGTKKTADAFEALVGLVFNTLMSEGAIDTTDMMVDWLDQVFDVGQEWYRLVYDQMDPCGGPVRPSTHLRYSYIYYEGSILKLGIVYAAFKKYKKEQNAPRLITNILSRFYHQDLANYVPEISRSSTYIPDIRDTIYYIAHSPDPLSDIDLITEDVQSLI